MPEQKYVMLARMTLAAVIPLFLLGCAPTVPAAEHFQTPAPSSAATVSASPSQGDEIQVTPPSTPSDPGLQTLLEQAKMDLAERLSVSLTQVSLVEITAVEWSDSSLDCPQPGMDYLQVITPGYRILLASNGTVYEYHSNGITHFVYCENLGPPFTPKP